MHRMFQVMSLPDHFSGVVRIIWSAMILFFAFATPTDGQYSTSPQENQTILRNIEWQRVRRQMDRLDNINKTNTAPQRKTEDNSKIILDSVYRRSTDTERILMAVDKEDSDKYANFLAHPG